MYKKIIVAGALAATLAVGLCACGQSGTSSSASSVGSAAVSTASSVASSAATSVSSTTPTEFATMEEFFTAMTNGGGWERTGTKLIYTANDGVSYARVYLTLTPEAEKALDEANFDTDKVKAVLATLPIDKQEIFAVPAQATLDKYVGLTGAELAKEGFIYDSIGMSGLDTTGVGASKDPFFYMITFKGHVDSMDVEDVDATVKDFVVDSITVTDLSRPQEDAQ